MRREGGGVQQLRTREAAEKLALHAAQSGDEHEKLMAEGAQYDSKVDWRRAARSLREAIALKPHQPTAYFNLGHVLSNSGRDVEAAQQYLEARVRSSVGLEGWATATAAAFHVLKLEVCSEAAEPEWWNDEGLKALSARVVRAAPNDNLTIQMRAMVLGGGLGAWKEGPRSAAELKEAATLYERVAAIHPAPVAKAQLFRLADECRSQAWAL